jgi:CYTH domain-containing protein
MTTRHVVRFRGVLYDVVRIDDFEGYMRDLTVWRKRRVE